MKKQAKQFAEETKVSQKTATRMISLLYDKGLDVTQFDRLFYRLKNFIIKTKVPEMMDKLNDWQINNLIDEIIAEEERRKARNEENAVEVSASENLWIWLFSEFAESEKEYVAGDMVEIQIMRVWKWNHPQYWTIEITKKTLSEVKANFDANVRQIELAVDENHEPNHKALAWYRELKLQEKNEALFASLELTKKGAELLNEGAYKYFSPEIVFKKQDEETGKIITNLLIGGAFTNRPFFKAMKPLLASEDCSDDVANHHQTSDKFQSFSNILIFNDSKPMKLILELLAKFSEQAKLSASEKTELENCFNSLNEDDRTPELTSAFNETIAKFSEDDADDAGASDDKTTDTEDKSTTDDASEDNADEGADDTTASTVQANEEAGTVTMSEAEYKSMKDLAAQANKLVREKRKSNIENKVQWMLFSESNKESVILPKSKNEIVNFALSLSEVQSEKFFTILSSLQKVFAEETGHSEEVNQASHDDAEKVKYFTEKLWMTDDEAKAALAEFKNDKAKA